MRRQRGFSLIELSIAVLIALFLLGGLVTMVMGTRRTNGTQSALSQLQDNQRIAMTLITNVVQQAGYFDPIATVQNSFASETIASLAVPPGPGLYGTYNAMAPGDTVVARFFAPLNDTTHTVIDCAGQSNVGGPGGVWYTNLFQVAQVGGTWWLQCQSQTSGAAGPLVNLIPNVTNMSVLYAVASGATGDDYSVVQYLNATQVGASNNWLNVTAIKVTLTFLVPVYGTTGGQMQPSSAPGGTTTIQRVIPVMSRVGVDT
ncbi:MAG TPA: PilW family protein [Steroidobacteraceae bacterium]